MGAVVGEGNGGGGSLSPLRPAESNMDPRRVPSSWTPTGSKPYVSTCVGDRSGRRDPGPTWTDCHDLKFQTAVNVTTKPVGLSFEPCATTRVIIGILRWFSNSKGLAVGYL